MKKLLMLGSSSDSVEIIEYAKSIGVHTIVTDYFPPEKSRAKRVADESWMISTAEVDLLEQKCREEGVDGIIEGGSEFNRKIIMELTKRLGLPCCYTPEIYKFEKDKSEFKKACREVGALLPEDYHVSPELTQEELEKIKYPVMVKPVDLCANQGVAYCYGPDDVRHAYAEVRRLSDNPKTIVEQMIHGTEYRAYYAMSDGEVKFLDLICCTGVEGKPLNCYVLNDTNCEYPDDFFTETNERAIALLKKTGCREDFAWIQFMREDNGPLYFIEMGFQIKGCGLHLSYPERHGFDAFGWMTNYTLGIKNNLGEIDRIPPRKKHSISYFLWTGREGTVSKVIGLDQLKQYPGLYINNLAHPGRYWDKYENIIRLNYAYNTVDEKRDMMRFVNEHVQVLNENGENMLFYFTDYKSLM